LPSTLNLILMKYLFTFLLISGGALLSVGQVVLQDFSNLTNNATADVYGGFGGGLTATNTAITDPVDASNTVRQYTNTAGGDAWKGIFIRPQTHYMDLTSSQTVSLKVYSTTATHLRGIIQAGQSGQAKIDDAANTVAHNGTGWETISFTFTGATGEWGELALRTSVDATGMTNTTSTVTAYIDDLTAMQGSAIPTPAVPSTTAPTTAPTTPPSRAAADVLSIYGEAYGTAVGLTNVGWDNADFAEETIASNKVLKVDLGSSTFFGASLNTQPTDASVMTHFHVDYWVADAFVTGQTLNAKWSNHADGGAETSAFSKTDELVAADVQTWKSMDVEISTLTTTTRNELWEFVVTAANSTGSASLIYIDNVYFYKIPTASVGDISRSFSIYPNPINNFVEVSAAQAVQSARVYDLTGKEVLHTKPNKAQFTLNTASLQKGVYLLSVVSDGQEMTAKLIK